MSYLHWVIGKAHLNTIRLTENIRRIQEHLTINIRLRSRTREHDIAICIASQPYNPVWNKAIYQLKWQSFQGEFGV